MSTYVRGKEEVYSKIQSLANQCHTSQFHLLKVLPEMIVSNSQMTILALQQSGQQVTEENRKQLQSQLNFARKHAVTDEQLQKIESLLNILK